MLNDCTFFPSFPTLCKKFDCIFCATISVGPEDAVLATKLLALLFAAGNGGIFIGGTSLDGGGDKVATEGGGNLAVAKRA